MCFDDKELNKIHYNDFIPPNRFHNHFAKKNLYSKICDYKLFLKFQFRAFNNQIAKIHLNNGEGGNELNLDYVLSESRFSMNIIFVSHNCI